MSWVLDEYLISFSLLGTSRPYNRRFSIHSTPKPPLANNKTLRRKRENYASMLEKLACVECMRRSRLCNTTRREEKAATADEEDKMMKKEAEEEEEGRPGSVLARTFFWRADR
jgi:hypothetical protein